MPKKKVETPIADRVYHWTRYCIAVAEVTWRKPHAGGYYYARIWLRRDPQLAIKCTCRHRTPEAAIKCGIGIVKDSTGKHATLLSDLETDQ